MIKMTEEAYIAATNLGRVLAIQSELHGLLSEENSIPAEELDKVREIIYNWGKRLFNLIETE